MNANSCLTDNVPLSCLNNFYFDLAHTSCVAQCPVGYTRSPWSNTTNSSCNYACDSNSTCSGIQVTAAQTVDLKTNYTCKTGYTRYGFKCFSDTLAKYGMILL